MKNCNFHSPLVHVVLRVVQPHPDLDGVALPDEVEDVLHDAPGAGAPGDQVSSDVFSDVMSCAALPRCAQHAAHSALAQTGQPWILSTFCSQSRHFSGRRRLISVLFVTCIKSKASLKRVYVDRSLWQSPQTSECQIGGVFVNIYPGRCHNPLSSHCSAIEPQLDWTLNTQSRLMCGLTDWLAAETPSGQFLHYSCRWEVRGVACCQMCPDKMSLTPRRCGADAGEHRGVIMCHETSCGQDENTVIYSMSNKKMMCKITA